jgi:hypothetical protein
LVSDPYLTHPVFAPLDHPLSACGAKRVNYFSPAFNSLFTGSIEGADERSDAGGESAQVFKPLLCHLSPFTFLLSPLKVKFKKNPRICEDFQSNQFNYQIIPHDR